MHPATTMRALALQAGQPLQRLLVAASMPELLATAIPGTASHHTTAFYTSPATCSSSSSSSPPQPTVLACSASHGLSSLCAGSAPILQSANFVTPLAGIAAAFASGRRSISSSCSLSFAASDPSTSGGGPADRGTSDDSGSSGAGETSSTNGSGASGGDAAGAKSSRMSLQDALDVLVDVAVEKVQAGDTAAAVDVLEEGIKTFQPVFPGSAELGELHNQAALLLLFLDRAEDAAGHAGASLEITTNHFGPDSRLTAHRRLRMAACRFLQTRMSEAAQLLQPAFEVLSASNDPSHHEASFYLAMVQLSQASDEHGVRALTDDMVASVKALKDNFGADSMIMQLALAQHTRVVLNGLGRDFGVGEALMRQHISLLESLDTTSEELGVACYKLATYLYAHDMLPEAAASLQRASGIMRERYQGDEEDMIILCKHRMGMICAASGEHRAAKELLQLAHDHYSKQDVGGMLAHEARIGLCLAQFRAVSPSLPADTKRAEQRKALDELQGLIGSFAQAVGQEHMLVKGAQRYHAQLSMLLG